jgi:hypothetical protein
MRGVALACLLAACGGDSGLLLDVDATGVTTVEVFVAKDRTASRMGLPPANSARPTQGDVYSVIEHTSIDVGADGRARILLQRGDSTDVPALLVVGYDGNHAPVGYAVVTDPSGSITLPASREDRLIVELDPAMPTPIMNARTLAGDSSTRIARWSATTRGGDDPNGPCVAVLHDGDMQSVVGTFFGPEGDTDCDNAQPECDDAWYLRVKGAGLCGTTTPPPTDDTMDACRIGDTAACKDGVTSADMTCAAEPQARCMPSEVCDHCASDLDPSCVQQQLTDPNTPHISCTVSIRRENTSGPTICGGASTSVSMTGLFGTEYQCTGSAGFADLSMPQMATGAQLALSSSPDAKLAFGCHAGATDFAFSVDDPTLSPIDAQEMETQGLLVFNVNAVGSLSTPRLLVLPITISYLDLGTGPCMQPALDCFYDPAASAGATDTLWHCAGN